MKKPNVIVSLLVCLALVMVGIFLVKNLGEQDVTETTGGKDEEIVLVSKKTSDVDYFQYTYGGETVTLKLKDGEFYAEEEPNFPLNQNAIAYMLVYATNVSSFKKVDTSSVKDVDAEFGFNSSVLDVKIYMKDGTVITETFGSYNSYTQNYFFKTSNKDGVYLVDETMLNYFKYTVYQLAEMPTDWSDFDLYTTLQFAVTSSENTYEFTSYGQGNPNYYDNSSKNYAWFLGFPYVNERACSTSPVQNLLKAILDLKPDVAKDFNVTDQEWKDYGLENPKANIFVYYCVEDEKTTDVKNESTQDVKTYSYYEYTLNIGFPAGNYTYVTLTINKVDPATGENTVHSNDQVVYGILTDTLNKILNFDVTSALTMDMCKVDISTVTKVEVTYADGTVITTNIEKDKATEQQTLLFTTLNSIVADDRTTISVTDTEPDITIKFYRNTEKFSEMTMTLTEYGTQYYRLSFAGENELLINKRQIQSLDKIIRGLEQ
ncbi:MAG: DUF4340 domain-containing protein [Clostridia bacterium]|nr:DUF4340 domain-containing protein [Clostridia bacterium]